MAWNPIEKWKVILIWVIANFIAVAVIGALSFNPFLTSIRGRLASSLIIGLPIGFAQWLALRRTAPISFLWVLTIPVGLILGTPISEIWGFLDDESILALTLICATIALIVGLAQWLFLQAHFAKSPVWLLSSAVGFGLGICLVLATNLIEEGLAAIIFVTLVYSLTTGLTISWMPVKNTKVDGDLVNAT